MTDQQEHEPRYVKFWFSREGQGPGFLVEWTPDLGPLFLTCQTCGEVVDPEPDDTSENWLTWMIRHVVEPADALEADHEEAGHRGPLGECTRCGPQREAHRGTEPG